MKNNLNKKNTTYFFVIILSTVFIAISFNILFTTNKKNEEDTENLRIANTRTVKQYIVEMDDGWYYYINTFGIEDEVGEYTYETRIDGVNLKYETLNDNYTPVTTRDEKTNKEIIIQKVSSTPPVLVRSYKSKDGNKTEEEELREINNLIKYLNPNKKITEDDLSSISFINFKKEDIVKLWNLFTDEEYMYVKDFGDYDIGGDCFIKESKNENYFQVGVINSYGYIKRVRIDFYYKNGIYLSDLINKGTATKDQKKLYENLEKLEKNILQNGTFNKDLIINGVEELENYKELFELFKKIEDKRTYYKKLDEENK